MKACLSHCARSLAGLGRIASGVLLSGLLCGVGCKSTPQRELDSTIKSHAEAAGELYAEGHVDEAIEDFRKAVRRAWAMDDPLESGNNAYNLAACMSSASRIAEAQDWLVDARVELGRAGVSAGNTWLLDARIASGQGNLDYANTCLNRAACSDPPCDSESSCACCSNDPCDEDCITKIPCVGDKVQARRDEDACKKRYEAQVHLGRARWFAEQFCIDQAKQHFVCACQLAREICDHELQAELQNVAGLIHVAKGEFLKAASHFDREAAHLRFAGNYREIPRALELAASAYREAACDDLAADRLCRSARVWYGRGNIERSWQNVKIAGPLAQATGARATEIRLALLVNELQLFLKENDEEPLPYAAANKQDEAEESASEEQPEDKDKKSEPVERVNSILLPAASVIPLNAPRKGQSVVSQAKSVRLPGIHDQNAGVRTAEF